MVIMCNKLHENSVAIPENGYGWKLFIIDKDGNYSPLTKSFKEYNYSEEKWINYTHDAKHYGFCFFLTVPTKYIIDEWKHVYVREEVKVVCRKIQYKNGIGKHIENNFIDKPVEIAICRSFRILEDD